MDLVGNEPPPQPQPQPSHKRPFDEIADSKQQHDTSTTDPSSLDSDSEPSNELMNMMLLIRNQQQPDLIEPLIRTHSTSSTTSTCSSISSATDLNSNISDTCLKQFILSNSAAFADQFAYLVRSRSSSLSDTSSNSSNSSSTSSDTLHNRMKQMLTSYQASINESTTTKERSNYLSSPETPPTSDSTTISDDLVKAKLSAVSSVSKSDLSSPNNLSANSPCKVCGDEASGFHYGVDSCEGCKGFFRRCITQGMNHQCTNQQQCEMTPFSRNSCQFCRLKKCFAVGMSREASRLGRRPKRPKENADTVHTPSKQDPTMNEATTNPVIPVKKEKPLQVDKPKKEKLVNAPFKLDNDNSAIKPTRDSPIKSTTHQRKEQMPIPATNHKRDDQNNLQLEMLTKLTCISDRHTSLERTNELEFIRTAIIEAHCQIWPTTFEKIRNRYLERPPTRATNNYNQHSNNHEIIWDTFVDAMVPLIMDVVKYCKYIPGFNQILQHDQVQLLKQGSFEVICVNSFMLVDAQNKLMLTPDMEYLMDSTTIKTMPLGFFMSEVFELGIQVSPLRLSDAEIALFNALLVMNPDRGDLQDRDHVAELQGTLLHVLYRHLKCYRSDEPDLFGKLMRLVPVVQEINRKHSEALNTIKMVQAKEGENKKGESKALVN